MTGARRKGSAARSHALLAGDEARRLHLALEMLGRKVGARRREARVEVQRGSPSALRASTSPSIST